MKTENLLSDSVPCPVDIEKAFYEAEGRLN